MRPRQPIRGSCELLARAGTEPASCRIVQEEMASGAAYKDASWQHIIEEVAAFECWVLYTLRATPDVPDYKARARCERSCVCV